MTRDVIDELMGIQPGSKLDELRALRPDVRIATQASEDAIFGGPSGLTEAERHAVALHVAELNKDAALAAYHRAKAGDSPRIPVLLAHATMLTKMPDQATPEAIATLSKAGLAPRDIVMLSQLIAHVNYEARLLAGLRLLEEV
ncbi:CMD domain-containing protein [Roseococcus sp. YIM B11640]|uniref:CMD domain-containing protein n=1 Tax=Roseococcus sp. YIM B11640 TaxID=3133973 RepID=UPI003C7B5C12